MNALEVHDQLTLAHSEQHKALADADARQKKLKPSMSEWERGHEEMAIRELREKAKQLVFKINGLRSMLRATRVDVKEV